MTSRVYRSAQGKMVDLGALALKNENMLAVSPGAKVNARGDRLDSDNRVVDKKASQIQREITQTTQTTNTSDAPIFTNSKAAKEAKAKPAPAKVKQEVKQPEPVKVVEQAPEIIEEVIEEPVQETVQEPVQVIEGLDTETVAEEPSPTSNEGLAAAIAKAKSKKAK